MFTKIQSFLNSLNGWQRIYVSIVFLVLTPMAIYEAKTTIHHRVSDVTFYKSMPVELKNYLKEKKIEFNSQKSALEQPPKSIDWNKAPTEDSSPTIVAWNIPYDGGEFMLKFPKDLDEKTMNEVGVKVHKFLESDAAKRYWSYVFKTIIFQHVMVALAIFLAGYAFVWNFRGFVKK
jgi:hypothetical protein